jgi:ABC-2 type transport system ATP-binding protein
VTQGFFPAIETYSLTRDYGDGRGIFDLDLTVQQGEGFGFIGPNGAGKTTTIRLLMGLIHPTSGSAIVFGHDVAKEPVKVKRLVGYLPGELPQFGGMRGGQVLSLLAGIRGGVSRKTVKTLAERLELDLSLHYRDYSRDDKQKLGLVAAMMPKPRLLILDEPTRGLEPLMQQEFYRIIYEYRQAETTVFMSSHVFAEVEQTCSRVGVVRDGRLIKEGDLIEINSMRVRRVSLSFEGELDTEAIARIEGVSQVQLTGGLLTCHVHGSFDPLIRAITGVRVINLVSQEPSLEEAFLTYYPETPMAAPARPGMKAQPGPGVEAVPELVSAPEDKRPAVPEPEPEPEPEPVPTPGRAPEPEPVPESEPEPVPTPGRAPEPEPVPQHPPPRPAFELRDWLADELVTEPTPGPDSGPEGAASRPAAPLEQLAWTDPGPARVPHPEPEPEPRPQAPPDEPSLFEKPASYPDFGDPKAELHPSDSQK